MFIVGLTIGQAAFAAVLAGTMGRTWVLSFVLTFCWFMISPVISLTWEAFRHDRPMVEPFIWLVASLPPLLFCGSLPFLLVRIFSGYRCLLESEKAAGSGSIKMEDFFVSTAIIAALLVTIPAAAKTLKNTDALPSIALLALAVFGVSFFIVMPITVTYFTFKKPALRLFVLACLSIGAPFLVIYLLWLFGGLRLSGTTFVEEFAPTLVTAAGYLAICLVVLRATGYRWSKPTSQIALRADIAPSIDPMTDEKVLPGLDGVRLGNRLTAVVVVLASFLQVAVYGWIGSQRRAMEARLVQIENDWTGQGGSIGRNELSVYSIEAPRGALPSDLEFLIRSNNLYSIEVAGTKITDEILAQVGSLSELETIDFSHTAISDRGLNYLQLAKKLHSIKLSHSQVTNMGLRKIMSNSKGSTLEVSGLTLTDDHLAKLPLSTFHWISIGHNPLTKVSLPRLSDAGGLDLSHTNLEDADLSCLSSVSHLKLDYTSINDLQLQAFLASNPLAESLSLRGTLITDASLPYMTAISSLYLSDCAVTADGLKQSCLSMINLALNDKKYNGLLFADRLWVIESLDLRESSTSDEDIGCLANVDQLRVLNLRGCEITDASLPFLASLSLKVIDISETKITASAARRLLFGPAVYISRSQCTEADLSDMKADSAAGLPAALLIGQLQRDN